MQVLQVLTLNLFNTWIQWQFKVCFKHQFSLFDVPSSDYRGGLPMNCDKMMCENVVVAIHSNFFAENVTVWTTTFVAMYVLSHTSMSLVC